MKTHIQNFDSIRAIAALLVVIAHIPDMGQPSLGATGVWIFFVLSGFLLYSSFENKTLKEVIVIIPNYFWKRFFRLIPAYYFALIIYAVGYSILKEQIMFHWFLKHITFQEAAGHFWSIKIEMLFYFILPFFMIPLSLITKKSNQIIWGFCTIFIVYYLFEYKPIFRVNAASLQMAPYMTPFFIGLFLSMIRNNIPQKTFPYFYYLGWFGILFLSFDSSYLIQLRNFLPYKDLDNIGWRYPYLIYPFAGMVVLGSYKISSTILKNPLLVQLGVYAYSFYLWHILVIYALNKVISNKYILLISVIIITFTIAKASYLLIEAKSLYFAKKHPLKYKYLYK